MILLIDTSQETATAALAADGLVMFSEENKNAREHASWLHMAIGRLTSLAGISIRDLKAVSVIAGPGSYTGLRVGMAAAKGFCYALKIPFITLNTLRVMAESMKELAMEKKALICPMMDARREEVFTAIYQADMQEIMAPRALILDKNAFEGPLSAHRIIFSGSGAAKWKNICTSSPALFEPQNNIIQSFAMLSQEGFSSKSWADPVYSEPVYLKEFFSY